MHTTSQSPCGQLPGIPRDDETGSLVPVFLAEVEVSEIANHAALRLLHFRGCVGMHAMMEAEAIFGFMALLVSPAPQGTTHPLLTYPHALALARVSCM